MQLRPNRAAEASGRQPQHESGSRMNRGRPQHDSLPTAANTAELTGYQAYGRSRPSAKERRNLRKPPKSNSVEALSTRGEKVAAGQSKGAGSAV